MNEALRALIVLKFILTKSPKYASAALGHTFNTSYTSPLWDLRTALAVVVLRSFMNINPPHQLTDTQQLMVKWLDNGIKDSMWVAKTTFPAADDSDDLVGQLFKAINALGSGGEKISTPASLPVEAEWNGYRGISGKRKSRTADTPDETLYGAMMEETERDLTILYFHGGAYYLMDPSTHRITTVKLAQISKGRCLSVRYRLSPQHTFPAALLDCLTAYLSLLYPPQGSYHDPVPASQIVMTGDSAGGGLAFALLQVLLELRRQSPSGTPTLRWQGVEVPLPLPAGLAANSGWFDLTHSLPSITRNYKYDYLPRPIVCPRTHFPPCANWPGDPPRDDIYADTSCLLHPLVSPVLTDSWAGAPPLMFITGEEQLTDESSFVAARAASQGVAVVYQQYRAMPHCFAMLLPWLPTARRCMRAWADFAVMCAERPEQVKTAGIVVPSKRGADETIDIRALSDFTLDGVRARMKSKLNGRTEILAKQGRLLPKL
ncbi:MAG: hypothetical protein M1825_000846 [Sarcosagium campestre]|nr:MAG: hypothetical protein M1825_000846 [Sarcosagium campestre]